MSDVYARITPQGSAYVAWADANDGWGDKAMAAFAAGWQAALNQPLPKSSACLCEAIHKTQQRDGAISHDPRCQFAASAKQVPESQTGAGEHASVE